MSEFSAAYSQASCLSVVNNLSCCFFSLSIIKLKLLFNNFYLHLLGYQVPLYLKHLAYASDAPIRFTIGFVNLEAKVIAIDVDKNNNKVTTII